MDCCRNPEMILQNDAKWSLNFEKTIKYQFL